MRAVVVNQASTGVEVVEHEKPAVVGHGQALVKVEYCGVCHTDLHVSHGDFGQYQVVYWATKVLVLSKKLAKGLKHLKKVTVYQSLGSSKDVVIVNTVQLVVKHSVVL